MSIIVIASVILAVVCIACSYFRWAESYKQRRLKSISTVPTPSLQDTDIPLSNVLKNLKPRGNFWLK